jgi:hypothetical protein
MYIATRAGLSACCRMATAMAAATGNTEATARPLHPPVVGADLRVMVVAMIVVVAVVVVVVVVDGGGDGGGGISVDSILESTEMHKM